MESKAGFFSWLTWMFLRGMVYIHYSVVATQIFFIVSSPNMGFHDPIWLAHIFQMGWFNHHLATVFLGGFWQIPQGFTFEPFPRLLVQSTTQTTNPFMDREFFGWLDFFCTVGPKKPVVLNGGEMRPPIKKELFNTRKTHGIFPAFIGNPIPCYIMGYHVYNDRRKGAHLPGHWEASLPTFFGLFELRALLPQNLWPNSREKSPQISRWKRHTFLPFKKRETCMKCRHEAMMSKYFRVA